MHFVLLLLQLLLDRLIPTWRDGLAMAVRADGRLEHIPTRPGWWDRCVSWLSGDAERISLPRKKVRAARGESNRPAGSNAPLPDRVALDAS